MTGTYVAPSLGRITVAELGPDWLARKKQFTAPSHYRTLESAYRCHVRPRWGSVAVAAVDTLGVESWITNKVHSGSGPTTVLRSHGVLMGILGDAVKAKRLAVNPARGVENLPRKTARRHVYLSADDVHRLAEQCGEHRTLVLVLAYCGVRWGEAIGVNVLALQRMLGHTSAKMTLDTYADLFDDDLDAVAGSLHSRHAPAASDGNVLKMCSRPDSDRL